MLGESRDVVGEEVVGGGRDEDSTSIGGKNAATAGVSSATSCVPNDWTYGRLDTELSGGMVTEYPQAPPPSFDIRRIGNAIAVDGVGIPACIKELDCQFEEERRVWERIV